MDYIERAKQFVPERDPIERQYALDFLQHLMNYHEKSENLSKEDKAEMMFQLANEEIKRKYLNFIKKYHLIVKQYYNHDIDYQNLDICLRLTGCSVSTVKRVRFENEALNQEAFAIWKYLRIMVSRAPFRGSAGRNLKYIVFDKNSDTIIGYLQLSGPPLDMFIRDDYIGWNRESRYNNLHQIMDVSACIPMMPFGMFTGGKLLAMLASTEQVASDYEKMYGTPLAGLMTTSIYGKSIQYDRLRDWKYLGLSQGFGTMHFDKFDIGRIHKYIFPEEHGHFSRHCVSRASRVLHAMGLSHSEMLPLRKHGMPRGIYFQEFFDDTREILQGKKELGSRRREISIDEQYNYWKERWFERRFEKYQNQISQYDTWFDSLLSRIDLNITNCILPNNKPDLKPYSIITKNQNFALEDFA